MLIYCKRVHIQSYRDTQTMHTEVNGPEAGGPVVQSGSVADGHQAAAERAVPLC